MGNKDSVLEATFVQCIYNVLHRLNIVIIVIAVYPAYVFWKKSSYIKIM